MSAPKITLDTNCFINLFDGKTETATSVDALSDLVRGSLSGKLDIAVTTRVGADLSNDPDDRRRTEMYRFLKMVPVVGTVLRWDTSKWDSGDVWACENSQKAEQELQRLLFPGLTTDDKRYSNKINDVDHLLGHLINKRDLFVTDDKTILKKRDPLKASFGIVVMTPSECVDFLSQIPPAIKPTARF